MGSPLCSGLVVITVGPAKKAFKVHQDVLTKIKYFRSCLESIFSEARSKQIDLPEDDPAIFAKLLEYIYFETIPYRLDTATRKFNADATEEERQHFDRKRREAFMGMIKMYILAEKLGIEPLMNAVHDRYRKYHRHFWIETSELRAMIRLGPGHSLMRKYALEESAYKLDQQGWGDWEPADPGDISKQAFYESSGILWEFFQTYSWNLGRKDPTKDKYVCRYHVHIDTPRCCPEQDDFDW